MLKSFRLLVAILCLFASLAQAGTVALLSSDNSEPYAEFGSALANEFKHTNWQITATRSSEAPWRDESTDVIVTAGSEALRQTLQRTSSTPIIATMVTRRSYEQILREASVTPKRITAIYLDQPPERQASFIRRLLPDQRQVGALFGPETRHLANAYRQALADGGLTLASEVVQEDTPLLIALNSLLPRVGVLLAVPDNLIYRRDTIKTILMMAFRYQRPVIGYSAAFAKAGGLAALYSTPGQIARQTAQILFNQGTVLPPPAWPQHYNVIINNDVASALGLAVKDEAAIHQALLAEKSPR